MRLKLSTLFFLLTTIVVGQTQRGSFMVDLDGFLQRYSYQNDNYLTGATDFGVGYAFWDNLFIGAQYTSTYTIDSKKENREIRISEYGMFARYYLLRKKNSLYAQTDFNHQIGGINSTNNRWNIGVGVDHFISENIAIEAHLNYNFYNRTNYYYLRGNSSAPFDFRSENKPEGIDLNFSVKFFLPSGSKRINMDERTNLAMRYLKKGNKSIELEGKMIFDFPSFEIYGVFSKSKFIADRTRIRHFLIGNVGVDFSNGLGSYIIHQTDLQHFAPIGGGFYFTPSIGMGPLLSIDTDSKWKRLGWNAEAQIGITRFFRNSKVELGANIYSAKDFRYGSDFYTYLYSFLSSEFFITEKLAIKPTIFCNLLEKDLALDRFSNHGYLNVQKFRLQFGFSYFY